MQVTEALIKARSGTFDLDSVFSLDLSGLSAFPLPYFSPFFLRSAHVGLTSLTSLLSDLGRIDSVLTQCTELWSLDVSSNALSSVTALGALRKLKVLDLSHNRIASVRGTCVEPFACMRCGCAAIVLN
jgi:Leucine-rich repeat (LRR) protein